MRDNETIIRELYTFAEGDTTDMERFVAGFADDGYMTDIPAGATLRGKAIGDYIGALGKAFPDIHRELFKLHATGDVVVVELAIRGTHLDACLFRQGRWRRQDARSTCHAATSSMSRTARLPRSIATTPRR